MLVNICAIAEKEPPSVVLLYSALAVRRWVASFYFIGGDGVQIYRRRWGMISLRNFAN